VVLGYNGGEASTHALDVAANLALRLSAHLDVVHVVDMNDYPIDPDRRDWEERAEERVSDDQEWARQQLHVWGGEYTYHIVRGQPADALCSVAKTVQALMVVIGGHEDGASSVVHKILQGGSLSHALRRHCSTPLLIVPLPHRQRANATRDR
jgi:nucleotide-binding universal stress UspA family protein